MSSMNFSWSKIIELGSICVMWGEFEFSWGKNEFKEGILRRWIKCQFKWHKYNWVRNLKKCS
jgi:hypothetical protein